MTVSKTEDLKILINRILGQIQKNACMFGEYVQESEHQLLQKATFAVIHS